MRAHLCGRPLLARQVPGAEIDELLWARITKFPVGIAPLTILLVERAVGFPAHGGVLERHPAALADKLPRRPEQGVDRHIEQLRKLL